jgi:hypothetical protein
MSRQVVPAYSEDGVWIARGFWALVATVVLLFLFNPFGCNEAGPAKPDWHKANCYEIPARYHGGLYCSDEEAGGNHGYVNPGSMEWEVE